MHTKLLYATAVFAFLTMLDATLCKADFVSVDVYGYSRADINMISNIGIGGTAIDYTTVSLQNGGGLAGAGIGGTVPGGFGVAESTLSYGFTPKSMQVSWKGSAYAFGTLIEVCDDTGTFCSNAAAQGNASAGFVFQYESVISSDTPTATVIFGGLGSPVVRFNDVVASSGSRIVSPSNPTFYIPFVTASPPLTPYGSADDTDSGRYYYSFTLDGGSIPGSVYNNPLAPTTENQSLQSNTPINNQYRANINVAVNANAPPATGNTPWYDALDPQNTSSGGSTAWIAVRESSGPHLFFPQLRRSHHVVPRQANRS